MDRYSKEELLEKIQYHVRGSFPSLWNGKEFVFIPDFYHFIHHDKEESTIDHNVITLCPNCQKIVTYPYRYPKEGLLEKIHYHL